MPATSRQNLLVIGVADLQVTADREATLITYALGSCLGITAFDPESGVGGLMHCLLPDSKKSVRKDDSKPAMFVDSGMSYFLKQLKALGANPDRLIIKVAGGANPIDKGGHFRVGERNYSMLKKVLWKLELVARGVDVGGTEPRTMLLRLSDGQVSLKIRGREVTL